MRILKHELPNDGKFHELDIKGGVVKVEWHQEVVALWFVEHSPDQRARTPQFKVIATGEEVAPIENAADGFVSQVVYVGTAVDRQRGLVWHVVAKG